MNISSVVFRNLNKFAKQINCNQKQVLIQSSCLVRSNFCTKSNSSDKEQINATKQDESPLKSLLEDAATFEDVKPEVPEQVWATLPYAEGTKIRKQGAYSAKPSIDPRETSIILFPGQGNQFVGMGKDLLKFPMAKDLFDLANYVLGYVYTSRYTHVLI